MIQFKPENNSPLPAGSTPTWDKTKQNKSLLVESLVFVGVSFVKFAK